MARRHVALTVSVPQQDRVQKDVIAQGAYPTLSVPSLFLDCHHEIMDQSRQRTGNSRLRRLLACAHHPHRAAGCNAACRARSIRQVQAEAPEILSQGPALPSPAAQRVRLPNRSLGKVMDCPIERIHCSLCSSAPGSACWDHLSSSHRKGAPSLSGQPAASRPLHDLHPAPLVLL